MKDPLKYDIRHIVDAKGMLAALQMVAFLRWCNDVRYCYWCESPIDGDVCGCPMSLERSAK